MRTIKPAIIGNILILQFLLAAVTAVPVAMAGDLDQGASSQQTAYAPDDPVLPVAPLPDGSAVAESPNDQLTAEQAKVAPEANAQSPAASSASPPSSICRVVLRRRRRFVLVFARRIFQEISPRQH